MTTNLVATLKGPAHRAKAIMLGSLENVSELAVVLGKCLECKSNLETILLFAHLDLMIQDDISQQLQNSTFWHPTPHHPLQHAGIAKILHVNQIEFQMHGKLISVTQLHTFNACFHPKQRTSNKHVDVVEEMQS